MSASMPRRTSSPSRSVAHSTSTARDTIKNFDFTEDKFDFTVVAGSVGFVAAGTLNDGAGFDAQMKAAVDPRWRSTAPCCST